MSSPLVQRVDGWFVDPHEYPISQENIRAWIYMATIEQLGLGLRGRSDWKRIHNFLTYLLLGWNPVTARVDAHISTVSGSEGLWSSEFVALIKQLLNFERPVTTSDRYTLLQYFSRFADQLARTGTTQIREEEFTLTTLMLWLTTKRTEACHPQDIVAVRACIDLYQRGRSSSVSTMDVEYTLNHQLGYSIWLQKQLHRLLVLNKGLEELCDELSYLAWFAGLVRVNRMSVGTNYDSSHAMLESHVKAMYAYLDKFPLIAVDENDDRSARMISLWGLRIPLAK